MSDVNLTGTTINDAPGAQAQLDSQKTSQKSSDKDDKAAQSRISELEKVVSVPKVFCFADTSARGSMATFSPTPRF